MECSHYRGKRIVLTTSHNVSFAGKVIEIIKIQRREGLVFELDKDSGFSVFCPVTSIKNIIEVPLPDQL